MDIALATLIAKKILKSARSALAEDSALDQAVTLRCGLADETGDKFEGVLTRAFDALQRARMEQQDVVLSSKQSHTNTLLAGEATS